MPLFVPNVPVVRTTPDIEIDSRELGLGSHVFELVVVDDDGNRSAPFRCKVAVVPPTKPVAVITPPSRIVAGAAFQLGGEQSVAPTGRRLVLYQWQVAPDTGQVFSQVSETTLLEVPALPPASSLRVQLIVQDDQGTQSDPYQITLAVAPG